MSIRDDVTQDGLTMDGLRCTRRAARLDLERAQMRGRGHRSAPVDKALDDLLAPAPARVDRRERRVVMA